MNPDEIYQALKCKNLNIPIIAESLGVSTQAVSIVIKQGKGSERIAKAISIAIEKPVEEVFSHYAKAKQKQKIRTEKIILLKERFSQI